MASEPKSPAPFVVRGQRRSGTITYRCPNAASARQKLHDFRSAGYTEITVTDPDGKPIVEDRLTALAENRRESEPAEA